MVVPISIIMTVYDREQYLSAAIESILAQTRGDFELLIWDDGSTDSSVDIARNYAQQDGRVQVVAAEHQGRIPALIAATAIASGVYLGLVDSDDLLAPTALAETARVLDNYPQVGMVYTNHWIIDADGKTKGYGRSCRIPYSKILLLHYCMMFHFRLIRRSVFDRVGGFDQSINYSEDYDLCLKLSEVTRVWHLRKPLYYYRVHSQNISHQERTKQIQNARLAIRRAMERRGLVNRPIVR